MLVPLTATDEIILDVNPGLSSIVHVLKTKILPEVIGGRQAIGSVIDRGDQDKITVITTKMEKVPVVKVIGIISEDTNSCRALAVMTTAVIKFLTSLTSLTFKRIASYRAGVTHKEEKIAEPREGSTDRFSKPLCKG